jgi:hypothetical protein
MMSSGRTSGKKVISLAVAGTLGMTGIATIYLPFVADRDAMRGMDEDGGMDKKQREEMQRYLRNSGVGQEKEAKAPGSMWSNLRKNNN